MSLVYQKYFDFCKYESNMSDKIKTLVNSFVHLFLFFSEFSLPKL